MDMKTSTSQKSTQARTRRRIVQLLKQEGPLDANTLAQHLRISAMAVRQHLYALQDEQLVTYQEEPRPLGRPAKLWQLTSTAARLFPEAYADLTLNLLTSITETFGKDGLERLLALRSQQQIASYQRQMPADAQLQTRLQALATIRTEEGYMADVRPQADGSFLLCENHCPICVAAAACTGLCAQELNVFQAVLGPQVVVERTEHLLAGARRCAYRVSPPAATPARLGET